MTSIKNQVAISTLIKYITDIHHVEYITLLGYPSLFPILFQVFSMVIYFYQAFKSTLLEDNCYITQKIPVQENRRN